MLPSRPYLVWSMALHAVVIGAAITFGMPSRSHNQPQAEAVETVASSSSVREPPPVEIEDPEVPDEEVEVEETEAAVPLEDPRVEEEVEPEEPVVLRPLWSPPPRPEDWQVKIVPRETEVAEEPDLEIEPEEVSAPAARVIEAIEGQNPAPEYPELAVRRGWHGAVLLEVDVDHEGEVLECAVAQSSGYLVLDKAAAEVVRTWRFRNGPGTTRVRVEFVLGDARAGPRPAPGPR